MSEQLKQDDKINELKKCIEQYKDDPHSRSQLIAVLHKAQELYGYVSRDVIDVISEEMEIPTAHIWGVATFYHYFNLKKQGKYVVSICLGTACYVKGAAAVLDTIKQKLGIEMGETTEDGLFSLQPARCLGACGLAPVVMVNNKIYGKLTPDSVSKLLDKIRSQDTKNTNKS